MPNFNQKMKDLYSGLTHFSKKNQKQEPNYKIASTNENGSSIIADAQNKKAEEEAKVFLVALKEKTAILREKTVNQFINSANEIIELNNSAIQNKKRWGQTSKSIVIENDIIEILKRLVKDKSFDNINNEEFETLKKYSKENPAMNEFYLNNSLLDDKLFSIQAGDEKDYTPKP